MFEMFALLGVARVLPELIISATTSDLKSLRQVEKEPGLFVTFCGHLIGKRFIQFRITGNRFVQIEAHPNTCRRAVFPLVSHRGLELVPYRPVIKKSIELEIGQVIPFRT
jgi:hypothetical protein